MEDESIEQRRIELQSRDDLTHLIANIRREATKQLDHAVPESRGNNEFRNQIEELVDEYISKTFTLAAPNIMINGLRVEIEPFLRQSSNLADEETVFEPFDTEKRRLVADLISQEESLLEEVAELKRTVPAAAAAEQTFHINAAIYRDEEMLQQRLERDANVDVKLHAPALERQEGVEDRFRRAVKGLDRVKREMPSVVAKMERARVAGDYVLKDG